MLLCSTLLFLSVAVCLFKLSYSIDSENKCILSPLNYVDGSQWDCSHGHVYLLGTFLNIGVHNFGTLGSEYNSTVPYFSNPFGVLADVTESGFINRNFAGDYISPSVPLEGN